MLLEGYLSVRQVEAGRIDHALHDNLPHKALEETVAMDSAVTAALKVSLTCLTSSPVPRHHLSYVITVLLILRSHLS